MLVVRKPSRETDLGRKSFVPCDRRGSGLHISETRRRAENPLAGKKQFVRYSHPIVSQNQTKSGWNQKRRLHFKSEKVEMPLKPLCYKQLRRYENATTGQ
jgi:hypothetical protein